MIEKHINLLLKHARAEILRYYRIDSCIISTRVAVEVMKQLGYAAYPQSVACSVYNAAMVKRIQKLGWPSSQEEFQAWIKEDPSIWSVAIGHRHPGETGFVGHLVAIIEKNILVDLSLDQASRPQYNMELCPYARIVTDEFLKGEKSVAIVNDMAIAYEITNESDWKLSSNWTDKRQYEPLVAAVLDKMKVEQMVS